MVQQEHSVFLDPPYLIPTLKGLGPFSLWYVDLITNMPETADGYTILAVTVYAFTKWVEATPLHDRTSTKLAHWFHETITCCFGVPTWVRCNQGEEFKGMFATYMAEYGIQVCYISINHPRANGLIERYNGVLRSGIRKM